MVDEQKKVEDVFYWEDVNPDVWNDKERLKVDDCIEGVLALVEPKDVAKGVSAKYYLEVKDKGMILVWGCTVLDNRMKMVKLGSLVRITYKGQTFNKRNQKTNIYKVEVAKTKKCV